MIDFAHHIITNSSVISDVIGNFSPAIDLSSLDLSNLDLNLDFGTDWIELAQQAAPPKANTQFDQNVVGDMGKGWNNFVKSGQVWALIIGVTLGYLFRSVTAS
jgi:hypothetical protein